MGSIFWRPTFFFQSIFRLFLLVTQVWREKKQGHAWTAENWCKVLAALLKVPKRAPNRAKNEVLDEKSKIVVRMMNLECKYPIPQFHQIFKPITKFFCTDSHMSLYIYIYIYIWTIYHIIIKTFKEPKSGAPPPPTSH